MADMPLLGHGRQDLAPLALILAGQDDDGVAALDTQFVHSDALP